jgi:hypothetical protein
MNKLPNEHNEAREIALIPGHDLLKGAAEIAEFIFGDKCDRRIVYYLVERERLPVIQFGRRIYARKSTIHQWLRSMEKAAVHCVADAPDEAATIAVRKGDDGLEYLVLWKDGDGLPRQRGTFLSRSDAEEYAAQLRCRLEIDTYQAELRNVQRY